MEEEAHKRVLVCPLGSGLGHASRDIPIIRHLLHSGFDVIAAGDELQMSHISSYFPQIKTILFSSFKVTLTHGSSQLLPIIGIAFRLPYYIIREHFEIKRIVREYRIDVIISDNRYGLWCKGVKSVLITHQLRVPFPRPFRFLEFLGELLVRLISQKFTYLWIPDYPNKISLAGRLSYSVKLNSNAKYIGILSRFNGALSSNNLQEWDLVGIASGPSPQREIFISLIAKLAKRDKLKTLILKGSPKEGTEISAIDGVFYAGHLDDADFQKAVQSTRNLITRAGYSTIMDLRAIGISGLIVPTPGQTEQEYLAEYLSNNGFFRTCKQMDLNITDIQMTQIEKVQIEGSNDLLESSLNELMQIFK